MAQVRPWFGLAEVTRPLALLARLLNTQVMKKPLSLTNLTWEHLMILYVFMHISDSLLSTYVCVVGVIFHYYQI